jgi:PPOX class probable F420-dependent enzyme
MTNQGFAPLQGHKYLSLETYRRNGDGVRTPVWFAGEPVEGAPEKLYAYSVADSGKAKRIRNGNRVRVAPCNVSGNLLGDWIDARAEIVSGDDAKHGMSLLDKKYFPLRQLLDLFWFFSRRERVVFLILPA